MRSARAALASENSAGNGSVRISWPGFAQHVQVGRGLGVEVRNAAVAIQRIGGRQHHRSAAARGGGRVRAGRCRRRAAGSQQRPPPLSPRQPSAIPTTNDPAASNPAASNPAASNPASSNPAASNPASSNPAASNPAATNPATLEPSRHEPRHLGNGILSTPRPSVLRFVRSDQTLPCPDHRCQPRQGRVARQMCTFFTF